MAQKFSKLFFSTAKSLLRLQRKMTRPPPIARKKATVPKNTSSHGLAKKVLAKQASILGNGIWRKATYQRQPSNTELLGELSYFTYTPVARPPAGMPLLVVLHGCQQTAQDIAVGTNMNLLADKKGFIVLYPQQSTRVNGQRCWRWFQPDAEHGGAEIDDIAGLIRATTKRYKADPTRVYIAGLSAGAGMAGMVAVCHPRLIAAVAMHSGPVLGAAQNIASGLRTMRRGTLAEPTALLASFIQDADFPGMPAMIVQGLQDSTVAPNNARQLMEQFAYLNRLSTRPNKSAKILASSCPDALVLNKGTPREYQRWDVKAGAQVIVRLCMVNKLGHAWSGGNGNIRFHSTTGPNASLMMWQFFSKFGRLQGGDDTLPA